MPYFPPCEEPKPYYCPNCRKWFAQNIGHAISCCVLHPPGDCCHVGEREVPAPDSILRPGKLLQERTTREYRHVNVKVDIRGADHESATPDK